MAGKVSEILLNIQLESASILRQDHNITNFFASTGAMDLLTIKTPLDISTENMMRRKYHDVYNVFSIDCTGKLVAKIFLTSMYT